GHISNKIAHIPPNGKAERRPRKYPHPQDAKRRAIARLYKTFCYSIIYLCVSVFICGSFKSSGVLNIGVPVLFSGWTRNG
ncbi:MAG: hypothetical protein IKS81_04640, partial [Verrucomicrobia bacterium]|nr:hypothetical protein [Verrucomicrobiota bacterium]